MKAKKLTRRQKEYVSKRGLYAAEWMLITENELRFLLINKVTRAKMELDKI